MKGFWLIAFGAVAACDAAVSEDERVHGENGWYVPRLNGTFYWLDLLEAESQLESMNRMENRLISKNPVNFYLYTAANQNAGQEITATIKSINASNFNPKNPTKITIHGWTSSKDDFVNSGIRRASLYHSDCNMIAVDWSRARTTNYINSVVAVEGVGKKIAGLVDLLVKHFELDLDSLHIIGHSLGAHVAGFAGKNIQSGKAGIVFGLDPALPLYNLNKPHKRFCSTDARYVEAIHSNGGKLGFLKPIAIADFYPNGGKSQPNCGADITGSCAHSRSVTYFIEAIYWDNFAALQCFQYQQAVTGSCGTTYSSVRMAGPSNAFMAAGTFHVPIKTDAPYGML